MWIGQIYEATYRMRMDGITGTINIFGPSSYIHFDDGSSLKVPDTYITVIDKSLNQGFNRTMLMVSNLTQIGQIPAFSERTMTWDLDYTGNGTVTQRLMIEYRPGVWTAVFIRGSKPIRPFTTFIDQAGVYRPPTGTFNAMIEAVASDGGYAETFGTVQLWNNDLPKIMLR
jgi:hypothetical protein